jgi:SAM-dependent methyltransferase
MLRVFASDVGIEIAKNAAMRVPPLRARRLRAPRTSDQARDPQAWLERYAFQALWTLEQAGIDVRGRRVVEIGPGDYLTSGLALLAGGAGSYTAIDRFTGTYSSPTARASYRATRDAWPQAFPDRPWPAALDPDRFPDGAGDLVRTISAPIETAATGERFDVVCSFQVGEHVSDLAAFARKTRELLAPGGAAVHRVDFGPHGPWRKYDDPLTFLRPPDWLWRLMGSERGIPNRHRAHEVSAALTAAGLDVAEVAREHFAELPGARGRRRLARRFRGMPPESLNVRAVTYLCRPS